MTVLFLVLAAVAFVISVIRRGETAPWTDIGLILLTVAFIFWVVAPGVGLDTD